MARRFAEGEVLYILYAAGKYRIAVVERCFQNPVNLDHSHGAEKITAFFPDNQERRSYHDDDPRLQIADATDIVRWKLNPDK